jgi:hypothetical protein
MIDIARIRRLIKGFDLDSLFEELGWAQFRRDVPVFVDTIEYRLKEIRDKKGVKIFHYFVNESAVFLTSAVMAKIKRAVSKCAHQNMVVFFDAAQTRQTYCIPRREEATCSRTSTLHFHSCHSGELLVLQLADLEPVRENLLALSDDIWLSIDHNDADALEKGVEFKRVYNSNFLAFDALSSERSQLVQTFTRVDFAVEEESGDEDSQNNQRIIEQLNREQPHSIDEDFTFKRPHGFILHGAATTVSTTWRRLYEIVCVALIRRDGDLFCSLFDHYKFVSSRGHRQFTTDPSELRSLSRLREGIFTEINLSANGLRDVIRNLLDVYNFPRDRLKIFFGKIGMQAGTMH